MELKSDHHTSFWRDSHRSNRTFMELKYTDGIKEFLVELVLIVPLWN